ncbi:MAG: class I SAM-dependent methyltransferase [Solirubrobacteraceae bacterium]
MSDLAEEARARSRAVWAAGNWDAVSKHLPPVSGVVLDLAGVEAGMTVLDVGCGSGGTIAIPAALRGATVTGADVAPEHFEHARRRMTEAGVEVTWVEGDAAAMPLADESFDRVMSTFGHAFAPDQEGAARELVRLCRPGGMIVCAMWTPDGANGQLFKVTGSHMPAPPPGTVAPVAWGTEARWHELVGSQGIELEFHRASCPFLGADPESYQREFEDNFGPLVTARKALGEEAFAALHADLLALVERSNRATDGSVRIEADYLVAVGRKPA